MKQSHKDLRQYKPCCVVSTTRVLLENRKDQRSCERINVIGSAVKVYHDFRHCLHLPSTLGNKSQYGRYCVQPQLVATQHIT